MEEQELIRVGLQLRRDVEFYFGFRPKTPKTRPQLFTGYESVTVVRQVPQSRYQHLQSQNSSSSKKLRISRKSIQFIQQVSKDAKSSKQIQNQDALPQRSASTVIEVKSGAINATKGKQIPVRMIKIKLGDTGKTKPLSQVQEQQKKATEAKITTIAKGQDNTQNPNLKVLSKSIQSRIKEFQTVNPKLLKLNKGALNQRQSQLLNQHSNPKSVALESNEEVFDNIKQQLLSQKRQKADLFRHSTANSDSKFSSLNPKIVVKKSWKDGKIVQRISDLIQHSKTNSNMYESEEAKQSQNTQGSIDEGNQLGDLILEDIPATDEYDSDGVQFFNHNLQKRREPKIVSINMYGSFGESQGQEKSRNRGD